MYNFGNATYFQSVLFAFCQHKISLQVQFSGLVCRVKSGRKKTILFHAFTKGTNLFTHPRSQNSDLIIRSWLDISTKFSETG